jgi:Icc-related predicted phosphoesterase
MMPGNDDEFIVDKILENSKVVLNPEGKVFDIADYEMISTGFGNTTPWHCPRDVTEEELSRRIEAMTSQVKNMKKCIFNFHVPPYSSQLDTAPQIDADLKPIVHRGEMKMIPVGSTAVRASIEKYQPLLSLHGHIHESRGAFNIGRTLSINPGSEYSEGILRGTFVGLRNESADYLLTSG